MTMNFRGVALASAFALSPLAAAAATLTPADSGGPALDLLADSYNFDTDFAVGTAGTTLTYTFENTSGSDAVVTFFGASVEQNQAAFTGGVEFDFGPISYDVAQGAGFGDNDSFVVAAGDTATLTILFGTVVNKGPAGGIANIDFSIEAAIVPVPAAGLLLLTAMGGLAVARRRKANAA